MIYNNVEEFATDFHQQISAEASIKDHEKFMEAVFVDKMLDYLHDAQELENGIQCSYKGYGMKVDGYDINIEQNTIDILIANYDNSNPNVAVKVGKNDIDTDFKRARTFLTKSLSGHYEKLEESAEIYDLAKSIYELRGKIKNARIILLTNGITGNLPARTGNEDNIDINYQIWDLERLYRFINSGMKREPVVVDFEEEFGCPLECLCANDGNDTYTTYLSIIPGEILSALYEKWGTRILERNVRAFLQARGKVNKGIRDTILSEANMFLAYNNGITVTADNVEIEKLPNGKLGIKKVKDFQIVNGGQTVASLWHAKLKDKASLATVFLQMKLTIVNSPEKIEEITPLISRYSNTQNKVNTADFYANDPFHLNLEKISRTTWAPDPTGGGQQSIWFYERSRGAYDETRNRERTPARIKAWDLLHPRKQKFDKLMLAKVEKTWSLEPYKVSEGAQKNFVDFSIDIKAQNRNTVTNEYFMDLVAKLIIWNETERIVSSQNILGYRANIVTYTIAWLLVLTGHRINLGEIWKKQAISDALSETIDFLAHHVRKHITNTQYNVTEYCKKEECWKSLFEQKIDLPSVIKSELIDTSRPLVSRDGKGLTEEEKQLIEWTAGITPEIWFNIARWGKLTKLLEPWENSISYSVGRTISRRKLPSIKQAYQAKKIYTKAYKAGFSPEMRNQKA